MRVFLSHISEEAPEARALKNSLEAAIPGLEIFVSAADIHLGEAWLLEINKALLEASMLLALCSPQSVRRPWVNFESGSGWSRGLPVIPVCYKGLRKEQLPDPMGIFQALELTNATNCQRLVNQLATYSRLAVADTFEPSRILQEIAGQRPVRTNKVGLVLCYGQDQWEEGEQCVFNPGYYKTGQLARYEMVFIDQKSAFLSPELHQLSGMILALPWRDKIEPEAISAIVEWVQAGGRLLLLGYELGDRHHDGNLGELSHYFGIDPAADLVGPPDFGKGKPYEVPVDFYPAAADAHFFTADLGQVRLANVQTIRVDPGGTEWLRVGSNMVYRPQRAGVRYRNNTMTTPAGSFFDHYPAPAMAVAVEAPPGLCGKGAVHMIGTWDLVGRNTAFGEANQKLMERLLAWLSGTAGKE